MIVVYILGGILLFMLSLLVGTVVAVLFTRLIFDIIFSIELLGYGDLFKKEKKKKNKE